jgi:hypothetical protein
MTATKKRLSPDDVPPPAPPGVPADGPVAAGVDKKLKDPEFGTPKRAEPGDLPRVCDALERAPAGAKRFKFRGRRGADALLRTRYVMAACKDTAGECYRADIGAKDGDKIVCTELPD